MLLQIIVYWNPDDISCTFLRQFQELDQYTVEAADGYFVDHACHTEKGADGKVYAAGFIYSMNRRNGMLKAALLHH
jgi:hypothetical protein